jgi:hypothetical protein
MESASLFERLSTDLLSQLMGHLDLPSCFALLSSSKGLWRLGLCDGKLLGRLAARPLPLFERNKEFVEAQEESVRRPELLLRAKVQ